MRALIIHKEHLDKILDLHRLGGHLGFWLKTWEMRSRRTNIRGHICLIEAGSGTVVGTTNIIDCLPPLKKNERVISYTKHQVEYFDKLAIWAYPWVLEGSKRLDKPIPYVHPKGAQMWVTLPDDFLNGTPVKIGGAV